MSNSINSLNSGQIQNYMNYNSKSSVSSEDIFHAISLQVGGDGESITKDNLDSYLKGVDSTIPDYGELKVLQSSWDYISSGKDSVTAKDMKSYDKLLFSALNSSVSADLANGNGTSGVNSSETSLSATDKVYSYLIDSAINGSNGTSSSNYDLLSSHLSDLLSNNSPENNNSDQIDTIINLMAKLQQASMTTVSYMV